MNDLIITLIQYLLLLVLVPLAIWLTMLILGFTLLGAAEMWQMFKERLRRG